MIGPLRVELAPSVRHTTRCGDTELERGLATREVIAYQCPASAMLAGKTEEHASMMPCRYLQLSAESNTIAV